MLRRFWLTLTLFGLVACTPPAPVDSGIEGFVTAGPSCPVSRPDMPCPDLPYAADLSILASSNRRLVARVKADEAGYFKVFLPPGSYVIRPESPAVMPFASEVSVQVFPHEITRQDIQYDTGIR